MKDFAKHLKASKDNEQKFWKKAEHNFIKTIKNLALERDFLMEKFQLNKLVM